MDRIHVMNLVTSYQRGTLSRRQFLRRAGLALGSVSVANSLLAACQMVPPNAPQSQPIEPAPQDAEGSADSAEATATPSEEMAGEDVVAETVTYPDRDGEELTGYLALPGGEGAAPGVIVIQEWWGLDDHIKDLTRRFAGQGYVALAPDLYKGAVATEPDEARKLVMELDMMEAVAEIEQAIQFLLDHEAVSGDKVGIVGYCMGGGLVLQTAVASENVGAAVPYYGTLLSPDQAAQVQAPVQAHYGTEDRFDLDALREMIGVINEEAGQPSEFHIYEGAPHAFFNDTSESYRPEAAAEAWERTLDFFRTHLG